MLHYILKRLLLIFPTLIGILLINFIIIQFAPGGPVEQVIAKIKHADFSNNNLLNEQGEILSQNLTDTNNDYASNKYAGAQGLDPEIIAEIEKRFGFDKPVTERFFMMLKNYLTFDFGDSFFKGRPVIDLLLERLPVSISLGLWTTLLIYLISIPLGIKKAVRDGSKFDFYSSLIIFIGYSIPAFLFSIMLIILFSKAGYFPIFPLSGLVSDNFEQLSFFAKIKDYFWHLALPVFALVISGFAGLTMLTKNAFMDEFHRQYVITAKAKGLSENKILYGHIFRNAMILVISGLPAAIISILFTGALLIEIIFSLEGLGLLGFEAAIGRDYPVMFATIFIYSLIGLVFNLIGDIMYCIVDPRINFEANKN